MNILSLDGIYFNAYLARLGHNVLSFGQGPGRDIQARRPLSALEVLEMAASHGFAPDAIVWSDTCRPPMVVGLEQVPMPTLGYSIDSYANPWHPPFSAAFDAFFVAQKDYLDLFVHKDLPRPLAWLPLFHDPDRTGAPGALGQDARDIPVSFVGTLDGHLNAARADFLREFEQHCPLTAQSGDFVPIYSRTQIVLNQSAAGELNFRIFEAAALGAAVLTEDSENGLRELFTPGVNILPPYPRGDAKAAAAIAKAHLADPENLWKIAALGRRQVSAHHSASARARLIARTAGEHVENQSWRARLANMAAVRAETAKCYIFLAADDGLNLPNDHRQAYAELAKAYLTA